MSLEAVQYVTRHVTAPAEFDSLSEANDWFKAQAVLYFIADLSDSCGMNTTASQETIGKRFNVSRKKINELVGILVKYGHVAKVPKSRHYVIPGVKGHNPNTCGNAWCEKAARTVFRLAHRKRKALGNSGDLSLALADAAYMADWAISDVS